MKLRNMPRTMKMSTHLGLSEHPMSERWIAQFRTAEDRARAVQLLDRLKLVPFREFEDALDSALTGLQTQLNATIAVYPVAPRAPHEIAGYDLFTGGQLKQGEAQSREVGRRRQFGSEDRVGHMLQKLQNRLRRGTGASPIECLPTLTQLKTQGIRHVVLVDDLSGSGKRIVDFWQVVPRRIKSLLSLKQCELWIVLYTITPRARKELRQSLPNFPIETHLRTVVPSGAPGAGLTDELQNMCLRYGEWLGMGSSSLGYKDSASLTVFEHGCPNNVPAILWAVKSGRWTGLFPNGAIPPDLRACFERDPASRAPNALWDAGQTGLALGLIEALDRLRPISTDQRLLLTILGLRLRGVAEANCASRLLIPLTECQNLLRCASDMGLYDLGTSELTLVGREFVARFRNRFYSPEAPHKGAVGKSPEDYYPSQCGGRLR